MLGNATHKEEATRDKEAGVGNQALMMVARSRLAWVLLGGLSKVSGCSQS